MAAAIIFNIYIGSLYFRSTRARSRRTSERSAKRTNSSARSLHRRHSPAATGDHFKRTFTLSRVAGPLSSVLAERVADGLDWTAAVRRAETQARGRLPALTRKITRQPIGEHLTMRS